jgi:hypothetical protein
MKRTAFFLLMILVITACSSTRNVSNSETAGNTRAENRKAKKLAEQAVVQKAIQSRKYVIRVNRLYSTGGRFVEMVPSSNFLIVNGEITSISLGYVGRSFGTRPITGINLNAHTSSYHMETNETKGGYKIEMSVKYGSDKFDVYITIGNDGSSDITINNAYIQSIRYTGELEPLRNSALTGTDLTKKRM